MVKEIACSLYLGVPWDNVKDIFEIMRLISLCVAGTMSVMGTSQQECGRSVWVHYANLISEECHFHTSPVVWQPRGSNHSQKSLLSAHKHHQEKPPLFDAHA